MMMRHRVKQYLLLLPTLLLFLGLLYTLLLGLFYSLTEESTLSLGEYQYIGLQNYVHILQDSLFWKSLSLTLFYAIGATAVQILLGFNVAYYLHHFKIGYMRAIIVIPLLIPPLVSALSWRFILRIHESSIMYLLLSLMDITPISPLEHPLLLWPLLILMDTWIYTPFVILILYRGITSIPEDIQENSKLEGAGDFQYIRYTVVPFIKRYLLIAIAFRFIDSLQQFDVIYGAIGGTETSMTLTLHLQALFKALYTGDLGPAMAYLVILSILSFISIRLLIARWS